MDVFEKMAEAVHKEIIRHFVENSIATSLLNVGNIAEILRREINYPCHEPKPYGIPTVMSFSEFIDLCWRMNSRDTINAKKCDCSIWRLYE